MIQYLVILLDAKSTSFCHYSNSAMKQGLISVDDLREGIMFAMKENLTIQFVYPDYCLPDEYNTLIESIDHVKIKPCLANVSDADVVVFNNISEVRVSSLYKEKTYVLRIDKQSFFNNLNIIQDIIETVSRFNIVITDIESFKDYDFELYKKSLEQIGKQIEIMFLKDKKGHLQTSVA